MMQTSPSHDEPHLDLSPLAKDAGTALVLRITGSALTYLLQILLARWMGSSEYGIYKYVISWSWLLAIPAGLGFPLTVLRLISEYRVKQKWGLLRGLVRGSWLLTVSTGVVFCLLGTIVILVIEHYHNFTYATPLMIGIWLIVLLALIELQIEISRSLEDIALAYAPYQVIWPAMVILGGYILVHLRHSLISQPMIVMTIFILVGVVLLQLWLIFRKINQNIELAMPVYAYREWFRISLPLLLQNASDVILFQTDVIMVGSLLGPKEAGIYNAAASTAVWVAFFLKIINAVVAPTFVKLNVQEDKKGLQMIVSTAASWIFLPSFVVASILIFFSHPILSTFGAEFVAASLELRILVIGEFINAFCGSVGYLLVMTGHQDKSAKVFFYVALLNILINPIGIVLFGTLGAAIVTAVSTVTWNIWLSILVIRHVKVNPFIFNRFLNPMEG